MLLEKVTGRKSVRMKIWNNAAILLLGAAIFMSGCTSKPEKNITESTSAGLTEATESTTEAGTHPVSKIAAQIDRRKQRI